MLNGSVNVPGLLSHPQVRVLGDANVGLRREAIVALDVQGYSPQEVVTVCRRDGVVVHTRLNDAYSGHTLRALGVEA